MKRSEGEAMPLNTSCTQNDNVGYGCIFCVTGKETMVADNIARVCGDIEVCVARQMKRKTVNGRTSMVEATLFPGYVFIKAPRKCDILAHLPRDGMLCVLTSGDREWQLYGQDEIFARWLFDRGGRFDFSTAYQEGDRIRIVSGPLKDFEGHILKIDKRSRNGQVELTFSNRTFKIWLGFEIVSKVQAG